MPVVTFVVGLCGSGKSWLAEEMTRQGIEVLDEGFPAPLQGGLSPEKYQALREYLNEGKDCAVVEATLFHEPLRRQALAYLNDVPDLEVRWECFEPDLESANHNCLHRANKGDGPGHAELNRKWITEIPYTFPDGANVRPIHRIPSGTSRIVGWILLALVCGVMILAGAGKVFGFAPEEVTKGLEESGLKDQMVLIGIAEIVSAVLLLLPWTWSLGILLTSAFWGGAIVSHMTKNDSYFIPGILLIVVWLGTWLRNPEMLGSFAQQK